MEGNMLPTKSGDGPYIQDMRMRNSRVSTVQFPLVHVLVFYDEHRQLRFNWLSLDQLGSSG